MATILLDTNVVSEMLRPSPNASVVRWLNQNFPESSISAVSVLELLAGAAVLPAGRRRDALETALDRIIRRLSGRVFSFDEAAARTAVRLMVRARTRGRGAHNLDYHLGDLQIAATAAANGLALATRNGADFAPFGLQLIDPWT